MATKAAPPAHTENVDGATRFRGAVRFGNKVRLGGAVTSIASATTVTLPDDGLVFLVTGTTAITSIVATGNEGRVIILINASTATIADGSNMKLSGAGISTADDAMILVCDGTNWYEVGRSAN